MVNLKNRLSPGDFWNNRYKDFREGKNENGEDIYVARLTSFDIDTDETQTLLLTSESALALIEYANMKMANLPLDKREALEDMSNPQNEHRRSQFVMSHAKEFCQAYKQPFVLERESSGNKNHMPIQDVGNPTKNGEFNMHQQYASSRGVFGAIKAWLKLEKPKNMAAKESLHEHASSSQKLLSQLNHVQQVGDAKNLALDEGVSPNNDSGMSFG